MAQALNKQLTGLNIFFAATLVFFLGNGWFLLHNFQTVKAQQDWVGHSHQVVTEIDLTISELKDGETGQRGYIITGNEGYLDPYKKGIVNVWTHFRNLKAMTGDSDAQQAYVNKLEKVIETRLASLAENLERYRQDPKGLLSHKTAFSDGRLSMDMARELTDKMRNVEEELLKQRSVTAQSTQTSFNWALLLSTVLCFLLGP